MDTLPTTSTTVPSSPPSGGSSGAKEIEAVRTIPVETPAVVEVGQEKPLAPEVAQSGVSIHPTTVQIPKTVAQLGVKTVGQAPQASVPKVSLPLTDDQIAQGLHQSITSSWRWLATWCVRRLKEVHVALRSAGGKVVREQV
jgi:hypothetical protein